MTTTVMAAAGSSPTSSPLTPRLPAKPLLVGVVGDEKCGKTSLIIQATEKRFSDEPPAQHLSYRTGVVTTASNGVVPLRIFDYRSPCRDNLWYRKLDVVVFVFDVTRVESLVNVRKGWAVSAHTWVESKAAVGVLVGTKSDIDGVASASTFQAAKDTAAALGMEYFEVSAKTGANVDAAFRHAAEAFLKKPQRPRSSSTSAPQPPDISPPADVASARERRRRHGSCILC